VIPLDGEYRATTTLRTSGYGTWSQAEQGIERMLKELRLKMPNAGVTLVSRSIRFEHDDSTDRATWRTGRTVPYTIYLQIGTHPSDDDVYVGSARTAEFADELVNAANRDPLAYIAEWLVSLGSIEDIAEQVHAAWLEEKVKSGVTVDITPYADLSEEAKDLDRATVRAVCDALIRRANRG
jgi:hypothetical protein